MDDYYSRFNGIGRLYSTQGLNTLKQSHVCVIGIGGVGSWVVEALARSGVGQITMIDMDDICVSNVNRQLHAIQGQIGRSKIESMAERVLAINPDCNVQARHEFFSKNTQDTILDIGFDFVVDAIDSAYKKCLLLSSCKERKIPIVTVGGTGGRQDPSLIQICDLTKSYNDRLLHKVRVTLRQKFNFPRNLKKKFKIDCVFSPEPVLYPQEDGSVCEKKNNQSVRLDCESGYGTASFVTGTFGFLAASVVIKKLTLA